MSLVDALLEQRDKTLRESRSGSFVDNMKLPVHGWFRYSAGFSAQWVESVIRSKAPRLGILDPFCGSGTTLLAAESQRIPAVGYEPHTFVHETATAKLSWNVDTAELLRLSELLLSMAAKNRTTTTSDVLLLKCYDPESLSSLLALRTAFVNTKQVVDADDKIRRLLKLAITSILRECSSAGTASWQYILPNKPKSKTREPNTAFRNKIARMVADIHFCRAERYSDNATVLLHDARSPSAVQEDSIDLVITSPPYPNNYDYADATRLEMTFWGEVASWSELHQKVRKNLMRSCSQHTAIDKLQLPDILASRRLDPIREDITGVCKELEVTRLDKGGKKTYHTMIAAYFDDLASVFLDLRRVCSPGANVCFVIGDSAPYGVYVPCDIWLGRLAVAAGFKTVQFEQIRERNTKWKNRKHRVPLKEGNLWITG